MGTEQSAPWAVAVAALTLALASRRSFQADPELRGTVLSRTGFLIAACVLLVAAVAPIALMVLGEIRSVIG